MKLSLSQSMRRLAIRILWRINPGDITIRHHYTNDRLTLHSFRHKDYWYHGKNRERDTMLAFARLVKKGDFVIEVGWHIGYITLYLANLVGQDGKVIVFEPGSNNVPYIRKNISSVSNIVLVEKAVTDFVGNARFYIENLSGQNNSLFENSEILDANIRRAGITSVERKEVEVACTTLDTFLNDNGLPVPSFIKIDVEGAELSVLNGMRNTLQGESIALMIEVMKNPDAIYDLLTGSGFQMYRSDKGPVDGPEKMKGNVFCIKGEDGRRRLLFFMNAT